MGFARVYEEHVWFVYGFFAHRVQTRDLVEDLTQATFERALRAWSRFDPRKGSERTWLVSIAHNLLIDHHRRDRAIPVDGVDERFVPAVEGPEQRFQAAPELSEALSTLRERDREVLALRFGGDLSGPEIASLLDISLANVHQIISRSLRQLRSRLERSTVHDLDYETQAPSQRRTGTQTSSAMNPRQ
jgi:RNA polymerase sigma-70 factor (ECF subfamily)